MPYFLIGGVAFSYAYIIGNRGIEEHHVLEYYGVIFEQRLWLYVRDVVSAQRYLTAIDVPKTCSELGGGAFSSSRWSHKRRYLALSGSERDIVKYLLVCFVGKADVVELNVII